MRPLPSRDEIQTRLGLIFPREAFDAAFSNPSAAAAAAVMLFADAVVPDEGTIPDDAVWIRPSTVLWMSDEVYAHESAEDRAAWRDAALKTHKQARAVEASWNLGRVSEWYAENSREGPRDETFKSWRSRGAMRERAGIATTANYGRWAMTAGFADLFNPNLTAQALESAVEEWRNRRLSPGDLLKIETTQSRDRTEYEVRLELPDGEIRKLEPGLASAIMKGVMEQWAPARLKDPIVLTISEPGRKFIQADETRLATLGVTIDVRNLLPDALVADVGTSPTEFWIIEVAASDGVIDEERHALLLNWAQEHRIPIESCHFLTAFLSRNEAIAKRRLKDLATGTFGWYMSEPEHELAWYEIAEGSGVPSNVISLR